MAKDEHKNEWLDALAQRHNCKRCGERSEIEPTHMAGDYTARLCIDCRNAWTRYALKHPVHVAYYLAKQYLEWVKAHIQGGDGGPWEQWSDEALTVLDTERAVFELAAEWVAAGAESGPLDEQE